MGCSGSKLDDLPPVALCRHRHRLLADALRRRHALTRAHSAYSLSLLSLSSALHLFLQSHLLPSLPSPSDDESDDEPISPFHPSDDDGDEDEPIPPSHPPELAVHCARHQPPASNTVLYQSSGPVSYGYDQDCDPSSYPYPYPYPYPYLNAQAAREWQVPSSNAAPPPPTPPPPPLPRAVGWDFLDPFGSYENFYAAYVPGAYTPSRSSREVREEEGIPELEEDDDLEEEEGEVVEVVKEVYGADRRSAYAASASAPDFREVSDIREDWKRERRKMETGNGRESKRLLVERNVVEEKGRRRQEERREVAALAARGVSEAVEEIVAQFGRASKSVEEVCWMSEAGELQFHPKNAPFLSDRGIGEFFEVREIESGSLSSTLQKLFIWEKKLYEEVRAEEKMRILLDRYCNRLKRFDRTGADAQKVESTGKMVRKLSIRIRIAIQVVQTISNKINKLRNEELFPQICEVIQRVMRMWAIMLECHQTQCQAISTATSLDSIAYGMCSNAHMEATKQLELKMIEWVCCFSAWINAQKSFVKSLNSWLLKCIQHAPRVTSDGIGPFSPGRLGAPPVFVICNYWSQALDTVSEQEVVDTMQVLAANVLRLWEQHSTEQRQKMMMDGDSNRELKIMDRNEREMRRAVEEQSKKLVSVSGQSSHPLYGRDARHPRAGEESNLQLSLRRVFEAMENFTADSMKAYEELHMRSQELRFARGNAKVP